MRSSNIFQPRGVAAHFSLRLKFSCVMNLLAHRRPFEITLLTAAFGNVSNMGARVARLFRNFNLENRVHREISKEKPRAAPRHAVNAPLSAGTSEGEYRNEPR